MSKSGKSAAAGRREATETIHFDDPDLFDDLVDDEDPE